MQKYTFQDVNEVVQLMRITGESCFNKPLFELILTLFSRWQNFSDQIPSGTNLLAVSKGYNSSLIRELYQYGQRDFGESRLQEASAKFDELYDLKDICWHFIGRLQKNKVRAVVKSFSVIHSVDSLLLAKRISRIAEEEQRIIKIMIQVKFREDVNKGGFDPENLKQVVPQLLDLSSIEFCGLMTMSPLMLPLESRKELFQECRNLANSFGLKECSMGMSSDWIQALEAGSTWLRLGSGLFGPGCKDFEMSKDLTKPF